MDHPSSDPSPGSPPEIQPETTAPPSVPSRSLPVWLSVLVILMCLGAGAWFVIWYFQAPPPIRQVVGEVPDGGAARTGPREDARVRRRGQAPANQPVGDVRQLPARGGKERWLVRSGWAHLRVEQEKDGKPSFYFMYVAPTVMAEQSQRDLWLMFYRVRADQRTADHLKMTEEQKKQLREISTTLDMAVSPEDRQRIVEAWTKRQGASGESQAQADAVLTTLLRDVSQNSLEATRRELAQRLQKVRSIFTDEQIKAFRAMGA